jgi:4-hydroxybenzoate polyprenyltransferase
MSSRRGGRLPFLSLLISLRPGQWTKNLFVFAALVFAQRLNDPDAVLRASIVFVLFCALSGAVYLVNDVSDREQDRRHPVKKHRPIAAGEVSPSLALAVAAVLGLAALGGAFMLGFPFFAIAATYLVLLSFYSLFLKHLVILDVLTVAAGFALRAAAGAAAIHVPISHWLIVCTTLLALFIALSKRRHELTLLTDTATDHRPILGDYTPYLLDQMISVVTASCLTAYAFYTMAPDTVQKYRTEKLAWTIPFVLYGIFRYLYLVHQKEKGGSPTDILVTDRPLLLNVFLWAMALLWIVYTAGGNPMPLAR